MTNITMHYEDSAFCGQAGCCPLVSKVCEDFKFIVYTGIYTKANDSAVINLCVDDVRKIIGKSVTINSTYSEIVQSNIHKDDVALLGEWKDVLSQKFFTRKYRLLVDDRHYQFFSESIKVLYDNEEIIKFVGCLARASNEGKTDTNEVLEKDVRDKLVSLDSGIFDWRRKDGYIHCNQNTYELMNFNNGNSQLKLVDFIRQIEPEDRHLCYLALADLFRKKKRTFSIDVRIKTRGAKKKKPKRVCISGIVIDFSRHFNPGVIVGSVSELLDGDFETPKQDGNQNIEKLVTKRTEELETELMLMKKVEDQLVENLHKERELSKVKSLFVNMVSHEMRTPLAIIQGIADLIENYDDKLSKSERKNYIQSIKKAVLRMTHTMDDVLMLGKVQNNQLLFQPIKADVVSFCKDIIAEIEEIHEGRKVVLKVSKAFPRTINIDTTLLYNIVSNLLSNGIKYSDQDKIVTLKLVCDSKNLMLYIKDSGIGIPQKEIKSIFKLFNRGSNIANRKGIGIGMFIVKHCVSLHGGKIEVASDENVGTTFKITLPILS